MVHAKPLAAKQLHASRAALRAPLLGHLRSPRASSIRIASDWLTFLFAANAAMRAARSGERTTDVAMLRPVGGLPRFGFGFSVALIMEM